MNRRKRRQRGQALVEFALVLPLLLLLFMLVFDFGRAIFAYISLSNAAREGARVAIVDQSTIGGVAVGAIEAANQATALGLDASDPGQVLVSYVLPPGGSGACPALGCIADVTVHYLYTPITPLISNIIGPIDLAATTQMVIEFTKP